MLRKLRRQNLTSLSAVVKALKTDLKSLDKCLILKEDISKLNLDNRTINALHRRMPIRYCCNVTIADVYVMSRKALMNTRNCGEITIRTINDVLINCLGVGVLETEEEYNKRIEELKSFGIESCVEYE